MQRGLCLITLVLITGPRQGLPSPCPKSKVEVLEELCCQEQQRQPRKGDLSMSTPEEIAKPSRAQLLLRLAVIFMRIGAFTFGGGFAMIPLIKIELVDKTGWMSEEEFVDAIAVTQGAPGPIAVNVGVYTGYRLAGFWGAVISAVSVTIPSFLIILIIAIVFGTLDQNPTVSRVFDGVRGAVVALIAHAAYELAKKVLNGRLVWAVFIGALAALIVLDPHPALVILASGLVFVFLRRKEAERA